MDGIVGWDYWIGLLDGFFSSQTLTWPAARRGIHRRGVFFVFLLRHIVRNGHKWLKKQISGPDFLKNEDILSNFIKLDQIGSS